MSFEVHVKSSNRESSHLELSFRYRFEAAHRFTKSCADSCATPHGHTWYARLAFTAAGGDLNSEDMVIEFAKLKSRWKKFITETVDHSFMHHMNDPILDSLRTHIPEFRGLPFPGDPTTEMIAAFFFAKAWVMHDALLAETSLAVLPTPRLVRIRETPTNEICFRAPAQTALGRPLEQQPGFAWLAELNRRYQGWWQDPSPQARHLR
jgi:6-pyruvoyl-tetrahydropterin synthase